MAELIWTESALADLEAIAQYIALENPTAARGLVQRTVAAIERLALYPESGRVPPELDTDRYREVVAGPCRIFYRYTSGQVLLLHVMRSEQLLRRFLLDERNDG